MQVVWVYLAILVQFTLKMCVAPQNHKKFMKTPNFWDSRSFKVTDVNKSEQPITSACYGKQHICTYLQPFSRYKPTAAK